MAVDRFGLVVVICLVIAAVSVARYEKVEKRGLLEDMGLKDLLSGIMSQVNKKIENAMHDPNGKKTVVSDSVVSSGNETKRITITSYFDPDDKNTSAVIQSVPTAGNNSTNNGSSLVTGNNSTTIQPSLVAGNNLTNIEPHLAASNNSTNNEPTPTAEINSTSTVPTTMAAPSSVNNTTSGVVPIPVNSTSSGNTTAPVVSSTNITETVTNKPANT